MRADLQKALALDQLLVDGREAALGELAQPAGIQPHAPAVPRRLERGEEADGEGHDAHARHEVRCIDHTQPI